MDGWQGRFSALGRVGSSVPRWPGTGYALALALVGLISLAINLLLPFVPGASLIMLYLLGVLPVAVVFGRGPAFLLSVASLLTFDWFFIGPLHTFTIANPAEWLALLLFLLTAAITGQLAAGQRQRAREAEQRQREAVVLYDIVRLMGDPDTDRALLAVAELLRRELALSAVAIAVAYDGFVARAKAGEDSALRLCPSSGTAPARLLGEGPAPTAERRASPGRWVRIVPPGPPGATKIGQIARLHIVPVKVGERGVGELVLVRPAGAPRFGPADDRLLSTLAVQLGLAVERARLRRESVEAEALRRTDELRQAMLNAVSHDLRTPLASIIASAGSLRQRDVAWSEAERLEFVAAIEEQAQRLNRIVGNLLDLSRVQAGSLHPEKAWHDVGALVNDVVGRLRPLTARHSVHTNVPDDLPPVLLDYVEIDQVLSNLIENATKYAPPSSDIDINVRRVGDGIEIAVVDQGPGISREALSRLFLPFFRGDSRGTLPLGTGLGLAVAKGLVEAHGGRIWAENRPAGGARFAFTLPIDEFDAAAARPEGVDS